MNSSSWKGFVSNNAYDNFSKNYFIHYGYCCFLTHKGSVWKSELEPRIHGVLSVVVGSRMEAYLIFVNRHDTLEQQVKSVLHEFSHIGREHLLIKEHIFDRKTPRNPLVENQIEREVAAFYTRFPPLIAKVKAMLI